MAKRIGKYKISKRDSALSLVDGGTVQGEVDGLTQYVKSSASSWIATGANDVEYSLTQPAGTVIVDVGVTLTAATAGSGNTNVKVGTADDGAELCAAAALISSGVGAIGSSISLSGHNSEGAASLAIVADSPVYSASSRTIYIRAENSATLTAGTAIAWIAYIKLV